MPSQPSLLPRYDAVTAATPLDLFRQNSGMLFDDLMQSKAELTGPIAGLGWDWVNLAFLAGGIWLLRQRIFTWHAPVGMLAALTICAALVTMTAALRAVARCCSIYLVAPPCSGHFSSLQTP